MVCLARAGNYALCEVEILFCPLDVDRCLGVETQVPLDLLDGVKSKMEALGMSLIFEEYKVTKRTRNTTDA